ncbi:ThuA domain-containing protein [Flammeovirgaceae bacterium SG7u.111]|nr:ThuA domain-containing protein [Flammeovirgaceae bacterium SG7u.132]WPO37253.1 ThuA domain-containing protein [Flammeovirgaceae bacterium SG7u.111]
MKTYFLIALLLLVQARICFSQTTSLKPIPLTEAWENKIYELAPSKAEASISKKHKVLLFSLHTGFEHWVIPHADVVVEALGQKSGAFEVVKSKDISIFEKKNLKQFDAIVLNNNCSEREKRNIFYDALKGGLTEEERVKKAVQLEKNLLSFVKKGGGLVVLHGGITMQNKSAAFSQMVGGSFDYHPRQQMLELKVVEPGHPITKVFEGKSFSHIDEPYFFNNAYLEKDFKPLLYVETAKIKEMKHQPEDKLNYVSWIKRYGKGRVFYASPSHNAQSYENTVMLQFYLNGIQYALGDLECGDSPIGR